MRHALIEKRIAGIIRWLERLKKSYKSGAMESALMEAECAKADLEDLRLDVWSHVKPVENLNRNFYYYIGTFFRISFLTVLIILLAVVPLSKDLINFQEKKEEIFVKIKENEKENEKFSQDINNIKEIKANNLKIKKNLQVKKIITEKDNKEIKIKETEKTTVVKSVPYDKVLSLIQTGERALKNNRSVIKIDKQKGER